MNSRPPRRGWRRADLIALPVVALLTWIVLGAGAEGLARWTFPEQQFDRCQVNTASGGYFRPNCDSRIKMFESPWVDNHYNECGYRSAQSCRALPPDAKRIAVLGTSISRGYWVPYAQTFAGKLEHDLTADCGETVDVQNVSQANSIYFAPGVAMPVWHRIAERVPEALKLGPRALILVMAPFDIGSYARVPDTAPPSSVDRADPSLRQRAAGLFKAFKDSVNNDSRAVLVARHAGYADADRYVLHALGDPGSSGYLWQPFDADWLLRLRVADETIGRIAGQAGAAGVPLLVVLMPLRAQAMLSASGTDRHGTDPWALGRALSGIAHAHGARFIDMTNATGTLPNPGNLYFEINGHPNAAGHAAMADAMEKALMAGVPAFAGCRRPGN